MINDKILEIHQPIISHLPQSAFLLSILGNEFNEYSWIMNNFVNIRMNKYTGYNDFYRNDMWYNCYHLIDNSMTKEFINTFISDDFIEFLINAINSGYYVYSYLNMKNISHYKHNFDMRHCPLIYGYNLEKKIFYVADFFYNQKYSFETCTFDEIKLAISYKEEDFCDFYKYLLFRCIKKKDGFKYEYSLEDLKSKLIDYYNSHNLFTKGYYQFQSNDFEESLYNLIPNDYSFDFGLKCYDAAIELTNNKKINKKQLHLFYCQKVLMKLRLEFLHEHFNLKNFDWLYNECNYLLDTSLMTRNIYLKSKFLPLIKADECFKKVSYNLNEIKRRDYIFTEELINSLN